MSTTDTKFPPMSPAKAIEIQATRVVRIRRDLALKIDAIASDTADMKRDAKEDYFERLAVNPAMRAIEIATLQGELRAAQEALTLLQLMQDGE